MLRCSTRLSYGAAVLIESCAGGIRTHDKRAKNHVLQIGSWSKYGSDEVLARHRLGEGTEPSKLTFQFAA